MDPLVSTEWLASQLGAPDLVVFDCTYFLPTEGRDRLAEYREAHIPGARAFDINLVADPDTDLPHMVPTAGRFAKLMGSMGVATGSRVVFYDVKGLFSAARGWWLMRLFGHEAAAVLDGGLPKWREDGHPVEAGDPPPPAAAIFHPDYRADRIRGLGDMKRLVRQSTIAGGGEALILDARSSPRFLGTAPEPRASLPSGHMPGARNLPFGELLAPDGTLLAPDALRARFATVGVDGERPVVTSCGSGVSACILTLAMLRAGLPEAAVYDGSWTEWAERPETPKEGPA